jgi:hypothetical protein
MLSLRRSQSHPVADKCVEQFVKKREHCFELFPDLLCLMRSVESDRGYRDLLTNPNNYMSTTP